MLKTAPTPVDYADFQFKLQSKLKVFDTEDLGIFGRACNILATSSKYGLVFVGGINSNFQVVQLKDIEEFTVKQGEIEDYKRRVVNIQSNPLFLALNSNESQLLVVFEVNQNVVGVLYDVASFLKKNVSSLRQIQLSSNNIPVNDILWNPEVPTMFSYFRQDGVFGIHDLSKNDASAHVCQNFGCTSMCWSPKGKQIVIGLNSGNLKQLKPDLKEAKEIKGVPFEGPSQPIGITWISNYKFLVVVRKDGINYFVMVDSPKAGPTTYTNYEDICYSFSDKRPSQFYLYMQQNWNFIMAASSNGVEVAVMKEEKEDWLCLTLGDVARAELPLSSSNQDTFPVGMAFNVGSVKPIPWGEGEIPPAPYLFLISNNGTLCCFRSINLKADPICKPPEVLPDNSGLSEFISPVSKEKLNEATPQPTMVPPQADVKPVQQQSSVFGGAMQNIPVSPFAPSTVPPGQSLFGQTTLGGTSKPASQIGSALLAQANAIPPQPSIFGQPITVPTVQIKPTSAAPLLPSSGTSSLFGGVPNQSIGVKKEPVILQDQIIAPTAVKVEPVATPVKEDPVKKKAMEAQLEHKIVEDALKLETELKILLHKAKSVNINIGSDVELTEMVQSTNTLKEFVDEIVENTNGQNSEIHTLRQNMLQSWAWCEDARSRFSILQDPKLQAILRAQPLDPVSERQLADIKHQMYYLDSQVNHAHDTLDEQWNDFQDSCKKSMSTKLPTMEAIYQSMVTQNATLQKQIYIMKDIQSRLKRRKAQSSSLSLLISLDNTDSLENDLKKLQLKDVDVVEMQYAKVLERQRKLSKSKASKLKNLIEKREVSHISVNKNQSNVTANTSNLFVVPLSPIVPKKSIVQKLDFTQSTPKPKVVTNLGLGEIKPELPKQIGTIGAKPSTISSFFPALGQQTASLTQKSATPAPTIGFGTVSGNTPVPTLGFGTVSGFVNATTAPKVALPKPTVTTATNILAKSSTSTSVFGGSTSTSLFGTTTTTAATSIFASQPSLFGKPAASLSFEGIGMGSSISSAPSGTAAFAAFGKPAVATATSIFGTVTTTTPTTPTALFPNATSLLDNTKPSIPVGLTIKPITPTNSTTPKSPVITTATSPNLLGMATTQSASVYETTSTTSTSIFGTVPVTSASALGTPKTISPSIFGTNSTTASIFGASKSIFGGPTVTTASIFGSSSTGTSLFTAKSTTVTTTTAATTNLIASLPTTPVTTASSIEPNSTSPATPTPLGGALFGKDIGNSTLFGTTKTPSTPSSPNTLAQSGFSIVTSPVFGVASATASAPFSTPGVPTTPLNLTSTTVQSPDVSTSIPVATTPSVFGTTSPSTPITKPSIFGTSPATPSIGGSLFGTTTVSTTASSVFSVQPTTKSIFGTPVSSTSATPAFGASTTFGVTATSASTFGTPTTPSNAFGTPTKSTSGFGITASSVVLGSTTTTVSLPSLFGSSPASTSSVFCNNPTTSTTSVFGNTPTTSTTSVFGSIPATSASSVFGSTPITSTTGFVGTASVFGTGSVFGASTTTAPAFGTPTTAANVFGTATTASSVFGTPTSSTSIFGTPTTAASTFGTIPANQSPFGTPQTTASSVFGSSNFGTTPAFGGTSGGGSIFGGGFNTQTTSSASVFGQSSAFGTKPAFGTASTNNSVFGSTTTTTGAFGTNQGSPFAAKTTPSVFGQTTQASSSFSFSQAAANVPAFGGTPTTNTGSFGFGGLSTGTASPQASVFGQAQLPNPFGKSTGQSASSGSIFGSSTPKAGGSIFGSTPATTAASIFGGSSPSSPFGAKSAFGSASTFGQSSAFGQSSSFGQSSTFGGSFSTPQSPSGPFSGGAQNVAQSGFGAGFSSPSSGFGAAPAFGSSPAGGFGAAPTFGGAPAFGSPSAFGGGAGKVFGGSAPAETFGSPQQQQQQNSTFASLATQPTLGFGSLAQQNQNASANQTGFGGNASFSSWR